MLIYDLNIENQLFLFGKEHVIHVFPANLSVGVIFGYFSIGFICNTRGNSCRLRVPISRLACGFSLPCPRLETNRSKLNNYNAIYIV